MKKYIIILLTFVFLIINMTFPAIAETEDENLMTFELETMIQLGIIPELSPDSTVTRSDFAKYFLSYIGISGYEGTSDKQYYTDVDFSHNNHAVISYLTESGYLNGVGEGIFSPDSPVTMWQVLKLVFMATGYDYILQNESVSEYMRVAQKMGISGSLNISNFNTSATLSEIADILYNSLTVSFLEGDTISKKGVTYTINNNKNILNTYLNLGKNFGVITANSITNLLGTVTEDDTIVVNRTSYRTVECKSAEENLGKYAENYYDLDTKMIKASIVNNSRTNNLEINSRLNPQILGQSIKYLVSEDDNKYKTVKISSNANVIYNGKYYNSFANISSSLFDFDTGYIKLIDFDNNNVYDVVMVVSYEVFVVDVAGTDFITFKYGKKLDNLAKLTLDENIDYKIIVDGETSEIKDLFEYDVVNIAISKDKTYAEVVSVFKRIEGKIEAIGNKGNDMFVTVNGENHIVSNVYQTYPDAPEIELGLSGNFYCDYNGHIASVDTSAASKNKYGYIMGVSYEDFEDIGQIKFLDDTNEILVKNIFKKIKLYTPQTPLGETLSPKTVIKKLKLSDGTYFQFMMYEANTKDEITAIYLEAENLTGKEYPDYKFTKDYYSKKVHNYTRMYSGLLAQRFKFPTDIPIFYIPVDKTNDDLYSVKRTRDIPGFEGMEFENITLYNNDPFYQIPEMAAVIGGSADAGAQLDANFCIVDKKFTALNEKGDAVSALRVYEDNRLITIYPEDPDEVASLERLPDSMTGDMRDWYYGTKFSDLQKGDIIQYSKNELGNVDRLRVIFRPSEPGKYRMRFASNTEINCELTDMPYVALLNMYYGEVVRYGGGAMRIIITPQGHEWTVWCDNANVTIYDSGSDTIKNATVSDLQPGDRIVARKGYYASSEEIFIIR